MTTTRTRRSSGIGTRPAGRCCGPRSKAAGWAIDHSEAGLYLWATHPAHDCWSAAELLATEGGILVAPGELYGPAGTRHVRVALTATDERVAAAARAAARARPRRADHASRKRLTHVPLRQI